MAVCVHFDTLTVSQKNLISNHLTITPKETFFDKKRKFYRKKYKNGDDEDISENTNEDANNKTVTFFLYDQQTGIVRLPYKYGEILLGHNSNLSLNYPIVDLKFTRKLYDSQIEMYQQAINDNHS